MSSPCLYVSVHVFSYILYVSLAIIYLVHLQTLCVPSSPPWLHMVTFIWPPPNEGLRIKAGLV